MTLSSAPSLLALFHTRSALGVRSPEHYSSDAAVPCLQGLSHHAVRTPAQLHNQDRSDLRQILRKTVGTTDPAIREALQTLVAFMGLLHIRVRHPTELFRLSQIRSSLELFSSKVLTLTGIARPSPRLPSCSYEQDASGLSDPLQGLTSREVGLSLSRLPTLLEFLAS